MPTHKSSNAPDMQVLFVCMGNICRSPTAQGALEHLIRESNLPFSMAVDSAGTHAYHCGEPPDRRARAAAERHGLDLSQQRARQIERIDFERFDFIIAMDKDNLLNVLKRCPKREQHRVSLFLEYTPEQSPRYVPDPYYGGIKGFDHVVELCLHAGTHLLEHIRKKHQLS